MAMKLMRLTSWIPWQLFLRLTCRRGDRSRKIYEQLWRNRDLLELEWPGPTSNVVIADPQSAEGVRGSKRIRLEFPPMPSPLVSKPLPSELWFHGVTAEIPNLRNIIDRIVNIRFILQSHLKAGLLVTWYPANQGHDDNIPRLLTFCSEKVDKPSQPGELIISIPTLSLHIARDPVKGWPIFYQFLVRTFYEVFCSWRFSLDQPISIRADQILWEERQGNIKRATVCLDFGTSTTAASYMEEGSQHSIHGDLQPIRELCSKDHIIVLPEPTMVIRKVNTKIGTIEEIDHSYHIYHPETFHTEEKREIPLEACIPAVLMGWRPSYNPQELQQVTVPSLLYALPWEATSQGEKGRLVAIGHEAQALLISTDNASGSGCRPIMQAFCYAPKITIGQEKGKYQDFLNYYNKREDTFPHNDNGDSNKSLEEVHPVVLFLKEYFDQIHLRLLRTKLPPQIVERVCYSYPIAWVKHQREAYKEMLRTAITKSYFGSRLYSESKQRVDPFHEAFSLDEASAAFLGFIQYRAGGLEGEDLVRAYQPFNPDPDQAKKYPKRMWVLVIDSGGGTTDVALLEVIDQGGPAYNALQSYVRACFSLIKAGLEVTRKIAEHLKDLIYTLNPSVEPYDLLRTAIGSQDYSQFIRDSMGNLLSLAEVRRRRTIAFYREAERIKLELTRLANESPDHPNIAVSINWNDLLKDLRNVDRNKLPSKFDLKTLNSLVAEVYDPVIARVRKWFTEDFQQPLDILLMVGRSSFLPGLQQKIVEAIPEKLRPLAFNRITGRNLFLHDPPSAITSDEASKTLIQEGLRLLYSNRIRTNAKALRCNPIDETRRNRSIGIQSMDVQRRIPEPHFKCLLVEADNQPIDSNMDLFYDETNPTSHGFYIAYNFSARKDNLYDPGDPPVTFLRVVLEGGEEGDFKKLRFCFRQRSETDVYLHKVIFYEQDVDIPSISRELEDLQMPQKLEITRNNGRILAIEVHPYTTVEDFRISGRIHLKKPAIDDIV